MSRSVVGSSIDSTQSALRLVEDDDVGVDRAQTYKFAVSVAFVDFKNIGIFCRNYLEKHGGGGDRTFWFSWVLFGKTFQTEAFDGIGNNPQKLRDTIRIRSPSKEAMIGALRADDAMNIVLCTQGAILASLAVPLYNGSSSSGGSGASLTNQTAWHNLQVAEGTKVTTKDTPSVKVTTVASIEEEPQMPSLPRIKEETIAMPNDDDGDDYAEETFDNDEDLPKPKGVRFSGQRAAAPPVPPSTVENHQHRHQQQQHHHQKRTKGVDVSHGDTSSEDDADDADDYNRHYRMTVDVRSIGGLARAANATVNFTYPFLGASRPIRTHPLWLPANTEGKLDGAAATFDCCMSRNRLRDVFAEHPLKISALSRTHMGTSGLGDVSVDLFAVLETPPHSYRCPVTNKMFKSEAEYGTHRQGMVALRGMGQIDQAPPKEPITIWAQDMYYPLTPGDGHSDAAAEASFDMGGRIRVVVIVEDLGVVVGSESVTPVKVGYKMHNGALYALPTEDGPSSSDRHTSTGKSSGTPGDPSLQPNLTMQERLHLEKLKADWEAYRLTSEAVWRESLRDKERDMRTRLEADVAKSIAERADDLRRAQEEAGRLEVRLRGGIEEAERQKNKMKVKDEQANMKLAQKTAELQMLQRRVRDEAKARIDAEVQRADSLQAQLVLKKEQMDRLEKRLKESEREFETFRAHARGTPESLLREEVARLRAQLGETRGEVERERRIRSEAELEKEHFRAQMHRLAMALKRERERSAASARQDLEQLRLEFLAREERYVLDGDREELRNIRHELSSLRLATIGSPMGGNIGGGNVISGGVGGGGGVGGSGSVGGGGGVAHEQTIGGVRTSAPGPGLPPSRRQGQGTTESNNEATVSFLRKQLNELLATGLYPDTSTDPVVAALRQELAEAEAAAVNVLTMLR